MQVTVGQTPLPVVCKCGHTQSACVGQRATDGQRTTTASTILKDRVPVALLPCVPRQALLSQGITGIVVG